MNVSARSNLETFTYLNANWHTVRDLKVMHKIRDVITYLANKTYVLAIVVGLEKPSIGFWLMSVAVTKRGTIKKYGGRF